MAGISEIEKLEARKRALINESEICRENLKAEIHNLTLYAESLRQRVDKVRSVGPWLLMGLPMVAPLVRLFSKKRAQQNTQHHDSASHAGVKGGLATALLALRTYRKFAPMVRSVVTHLVSRYRRQRVES